MTDDWPSHTDELTRKATEQLSVWMDRFDKGIIGLSTAISVVSAIYDTTSGLIDRGVSDMIADVHRDLISAAKAG